MAKKIVVDLNTIPTFKELGKNWMIAYVAEKHPEDKKWFKGIAFDMRKKKQARLKFDANGKPIMKQAKDKKGDKKYNPDGTPVMIQAKEYFDIEDSEEKPVFNLLKAKNAFVDKYADELPGLKPEVEEKEPTAIEQMEDW